jgi:hypothetical protein
LKRHSDNFKRHGHRPQQRLRHLLRLARPHLSPKSCRKWQARPPLANASPAAETNNGMNSHIPVSLLLLCCL